MTRAAKEGKTYAFAPARRGTQARRAMTGNSAYDSMQGQTCANCNAGLTARYCAHCGQDSHISLTLHHFIEEAVEGLTHFDSTFWRTFLPLLFKPGFITKEYLAGKRKAFAPPVRTYLVLSIAYFLLASLTATQTRIVGLSGEQVGPQNCAGMAKGLSWLAPLVTDIEGSCQRAMRDQGHALTGVLMGMLPKVMFVVLPLVALVQYWLYRRRQPLYVANLIFVLHLQSFYFLTASIFLIVGAGLTAVLHTQPGVVGSWLDFVLFVWSAIYLFIATRRVYASGVVKTLLSILVVAIAYLLFWAVGVSMAGMYALLHS